MLSLTRRELLAFAALTTTGCWVRKNATPPTSPPAGHALLTIIEAQWEPLAKGNVWVIEGDRLIGKFYPGRYMTFELTPGEHEFTCLDEFKSVGTLRVTAEAGRHYRARIQRYSGTTVPIVAGVTVVPYKMYRFGWVAVLPDTPEWDLDTQGKGLKWSVAPPEPSNRTRKKAQKIARRAARAKAKLEPVILGPEDGAHLQ